MAVKPSLMDGLDLVADAVAKAPRSTPSTWAWGVVVTTTKPVTVVLEHDLDATAREVSANASGPVQVGDRVLLLRQRRRLTIVANPSAQALPAPRRVYCPGPLSIANNTATVITSWSAQSSGDAGNATTGIYYQGGGLFRVPLTGIYSVSMQSRWASNTTGSRELHLRQNGTARESTNINASGNHLGIAAISVTIRCAAGDTISVSARQSSGAALDYGSTEGWSWMTIACLGRL